MIGPWSLSRSLELDLNAQLQDGADTETVLRNAQKALVAHAFDIRELGVHYTGNRCRFGVVGVFSCQRPDDPHPSLKIRTGHNYSPYRGAIKSCGEMGVDQQALRLYAKYFGNIFAELLVNCGPDDPERVRSIVNSDLFEQCPPCHDCLAKLNSNPAFGSPTQLLLVNERGQTETTLGKVNVLMDAIERPPAAIEFVGQLATARPVPAGQVW